MRLSRVALALALAVAGCSTAAPPSPPAATQAADVISSTLELNLSTLLYEPAKPGKYPLVMFVHGYTGMPIDHDRLLRNWARAGFIVAAPTMAKTARNSSPQDAEDLINQPAAVSETLTQVLAKLGDKVDQEKIAAAGFSLGGMTVVGLFSKFRDPRLKTGIVMAGSDWLVGHEYSGTPANMFFIHGRVDTTVSFATGMGAYEPLKWPKMLLDLPNGDHLAPYRGLENPEYRLVEATTTLYLKWTLTGDAAAKETLAVAKGITITA